jgi:hypothetical protein
MLALLLALLVRAGIPAGYMLAPGDALPRIVPCDGFAPATPHHHGAKHDSHGKNSEAPCAFALVAPPALPETPPLLVPPQPTPGLLAPTNAGLAAPHLRAILPPPATGPPSA